MLLDPTVPALARVIAMEAAVARGAATSVVEVAGGFVVTNEHVPLSHEHNQLWLLDAAATDAGRMLADLDRTLGAAGLRHRRVTAHGGPVDDAVAAALADAGLAPAETVLMIHEGPPPGATGPAASRVTTVPFEEVRPAYVDSWRAALPRGSDEMVRQLADRTRWTARACTLTHFVARVGGRVVARAELRVLDGVAQVEDVETVPEWRRRGFAAAVVARATAAGYEAGCDLVFLQSAPEEGPRRLYAGLGYREVGTETSFTTASRS